MNDLRGIIGADDRLLSVDGALGVDARHGLRRSCSAVQLVGLPAGSGEGCVGAGVVPDADISRDPVAGEVAVVAPVRTGVALMGTLERVAIWDSPAVDHLAALDGCCADCREADGEQGSDGGDGMHLLSHQRN